MKQVKKLWLILLVSVALFTGCRQEAQKETQVAPQPVAREIWTKEQAADWYKQWGWLRGSDFIPSTAINQLEMWQAETFDTATINRELGWAEGIGMNSMRVYLHHAAWEIDKEGFKNRVDQYLT